jgi:hypothetical protein
MSHTWIDVLGLACGKKTNSNPTQLQINKANGKKAEQLVYDKLLKNPDVVVLGRQVYIKTPGVGRGRYADILIQNKKTGKIINVEVKSGGAKRSSAQVFKDKVINSGGEIFGKNAPLYMNGNPLAGMYQNS